MALAVPMLAGVIVNRVVPKNDPHLLKVLAAVMAALIGYSVLATFLRARFLLRLRGRFDVDMTLDSSAPGPRPPDPYQLGRKPFPCGSGISLPG